MTTTKTKSVPSAELRFGQIGKAIDELLDKSSSAAADVREDIAKELERIDGRLSAARAQVGQDVAFTRDDLVEALRKELDVWKTRVDELKVQTALGLMEVNDRLAPHLHRVEATISRIRRDVEELADAEMVDEEGLGYSIKISMTGLREDLEEVDRSKGASDVVKPT
jgi:cob(I)alamin adenosyltransferase